MGRRKVEKNHTRRERLIELMNRENLSQNELARQTGIKQQRISEMLKDGDSFQNLTEEMAGEIIKAYPSYLLTWLLGYTEYPTEAEESAARLLKLQESAEQEKVLFELIARMGGWSVEFAPIFAAPFTGEDEVYDSTDIGLRSFDGYATVSNGSTSKVLNKVQFRDFVKKQLDYFNFEIEHIRSTPPIKGERQ